MGMVPELHRLSVDDATAWVDRAISPLPAESVSLFAACTRVLADRICTVQPIPLADCAALDGFAVAASATVGATSYNPLLLPLRTVSAGDAIPTGTDAVIPLGLAEPKPSNLVECVEAVAPGEKVEAQGSVAAAGGLLVPAGTQLSPLHIGMLIRAGMMSVDVVQRPRVRIVVTPKNSEIDGNGPMIRGLVQRDGGVIADVIAAERTSQGIQNALEADGVDIVFVIGGTGPGADDHAAAALAAAGELAIHGIALRPGETTGLGHTRNRVPVALLAGSSAACLFGYEMLAGRAVRRLGGRNPELPYRRRLMHTRRKIVSAIGMTEICPVRCDARDVADPLPSFGEIGMMAAVAADGFVIVPEASEGHPQGAPVSVYLYEARCIDG
jgi:molybdopterin molybdotransferase